MKKNDKGFTLIELLAVIVVLAIIMVIATMAVNRQIKKARKDANEINKEVIAKAAKTCLVENAQEDCNTIEELQEKGYLEEFEDPWTGESNNLDNSYAIIINEDGTDADVIYFGEGITEENETPPEEYFSWCNNEHTCTDGLTSDGKEWLQKHDDILIIPGNVTTIKDCQASSSDCTDFSGINIEALVVTKNVNISAHFKNSTINTIRIDGGKLTDETFGSNTNYKFYNSKIRKMILANASDFTIGQYTFRDSSIDYFEIKSGSVGWQALQNIKIDTLVIGENVTKLSGNAFTGSDINTLIIKSNNLKSNSKDQAFRSSQNGTNVIIESNVTKLPKKLFANTVTSYGNFVREIKIDNVEIRGDKTRFSKKDLYNAGLRWDNIPEDVGDPNDEESFNLYLSESDFAEGGRYCGPVKKAREYAKTHSWLKVDESICVN